MLKQHEASTMTRKKLIGHLWMMGALLWVAGAVILLSGCATLGGNNEVVIETVEQPRMPAVPINGAIYSAGTELALFEDIKARRVGDILTVMLVEQTSGIKSSDTNVNQSTGISVDPPLVGLDNRTDLGLDLGSSNTFTGESGASQSNSLSGSITVTVTEVLPGGNMRVQGEKWIEINNGEEYIRLDGIVRPRDVRPSNTILSTQVADARISYSGKGTQHHANLVGWVGRILFSPLRPF